MKTNPQVKRLFRNGVPRGRVSWFISFGFHALIVLILAVLWQGGRPHGLSEENSREVGIALKFENKAKRYYSDSSGDQSQPVGSDGQVQQSQQASMDDVVPNSIPADPRKSLQNSRTAALGAVDDAASASDGSSGITGALTGGGFGRSPGPTGSASLFGIQSPGNKFVYVFDRSGSMGGVGRTPLDYAKAELITSIQSLNKTQQFQIVFYNERPIIFNPAGSSGRLSFATEENKQRAIAFIRSVTAAGGTQHDTAILLALRLQPDVIFFLTDADEPRLSDAKLEQIHRLANGVVIHTIEFGLGPKNGSENFLSRMARQNGGQHIYIDISQALR